MDIEQRPDSGQSLPDLVEEGLGIEIILGFELTEPPKSSALGARILTYQKGILK